MKIQNGALIALLAMTAGYFIGQIESPIDLPEEADIAEASLQIVSANEPCTDLSAASFLAMENYIEAKNIYLGSGPDAPGIKNDIEKSIFFGLGDALLEISQKQIDCLSKYTSRAEPND